MKKIINYFIFFALICGIVSPLYAQDVSPCPTPKCCDRCIDSFNRKSFILNDTLDRHLLVPTAKGYSHIVPEHVREGVTNFFNNITQISVFANDFLQGNFYQGYSDSWRFIINSTVGVAGIFDVASHVGLDYHATDFGLTLAKWGWVNSEYLVIPFLGPSTIRDALGRTVDYFAFSPYPYLTPIGLVYGVRALYYLNLRAEILAYQNLVQQASFDPYLFQKNAYLQHQQSLINQMIQGEDSNWHDHAANYLHSRKPSLLTLYYYQIPVLN